MTKLTGILEYIAEVAGETVAIKLATEYGGTYVNIPKNPKMENKLVKIIGLEACIILEKEIGSGELLIPMSSFRGAKKRRADAVKMLQDGISQAKIAKDLEIHIRTVERINSSVKKNEPPLLEFINKLDDAS